MSAEYNIVKAKAEESILLNQLMRHSLSVWKYSEIELEKLMEHLKVAPELIDQSICYTARLSNAIKGFILFSEQENFLKKLYVDPSCINTGVGTLLWQRLIQDLREKNFKHINFLSDPNAQGFYEKKGAFKIGRRASKVFDGVYIPIMRYTL